MIRLLRHGLIFAELFPVDTPSLVARYNAALKKLTGKTTKLDNFMIDISGYAPEIADEFGDQNYLNPHGVNRQFILLSTRQKDCPLLNATISTDRQILSDFIADNEAQLFALTARDAVAGELNNSILRADSPADLLKIRAISVEADTSSAHLADAAKLHGKIDRFMHEQDAWWDDVLIAEMIDLSKRTGDVTRHPIMFSKTVYQQDNFFTELFGGLYVFRDTARAAAIFRSKPEKMPLKKVMTFRDRAGILSFLHENRLIEPIVDTGMNAAALIRQRLDFILIDAALEAGHDVASLSRQEIRAMHRRNLDRMPAAYHTLREVLRWVEQGGPQPRIHADNPAAFYLIRAKQGPDRDLVNMLIAELAPQDLRQLYICHKQAFLSAYASWDEKKRDYVANLLAKEYVLDKDGMREALFGGEEAMPAIRQGPWGPRG